MVWRRICRSGSWTCTVTRGGSATSSGTPPRRTSSSVPASTTRCDWLFSLTALYIILFITPYSKNLSNSLYNWLQGVFALSFDRVFPDTFGFEDKLTFSVCSDFLSFRNILFTLWFSIFTLSSLYIWWFCFDPSFSLCLDGKDLVEYILMFCKERDNINVALFSNVWNIYPNENKNIPSNAGVFNSG